MYGKGVKWGWSRVTDEEQAGLGPASLGSVYLLPYHTRHLSLSKFNNSHLCVFLQNKTFYDFVALWSVVAVSHRDATLSPLTFAVTKNTITRSVVLLLSFAFDLNECVCCCCFQTKLHHSSSFLSRLSLTMIILKSSCRRLTGRGVFPH